MSRPLRSRKSPLSDKAMAHLDLAISKAHSMGPVWDNDARNLNLAPLDLRRSFSMRLTPREQIQMSCVVCKNPFMALDRRAKYCSPKCLNKAHRARLKPRTLSCQMCASPFTTNKIWLKLCSRECLSAQRRLNSNALRTRKVTANEKV